MAESPVQVEQCVLVFHIAGSHPATVQSNKSMLHSASSVRTISITKAMT